MNYTFGLLVFLSKPGIAMELIEADDIGRKAVEDFIDSLLVKNLSFTKIGSEYDQEIPQSQTVDNPVASRGSAAQPSRDTRKTN